MLLLISWISNSNMNTPFLRAAFEVIGGGGCVFPWHRDRQLLTRRKAYDEHET
jgi:hypothetical protein